MKKLVLLTIAALALFGVTNVFGDTLQLIDVIPSQPVTGHYDGLGNLTALAGAYEIKINSGAPTLVYCNEFQLISEGVVYSGYTISPLPDTDTNKRVAYILEHYAPSPTNFDQNVNAQVAIWEIISLIPGDLASGDFSALPWSGYGSFAGAQAIVSQVMALDVSKLSTSGVELISNGTYQNYVKVPEPGILILLGIAMSAIGAASWRLRKL